MTAVQLLVVDRHQHRHDHGITRESLLVQEARHHVGALDDQVGALVDRPLHEGVDAHSHRRRLVAEADDHGVGAAGQGMANEAGGVE